MLSEEGDPKIREWIKENIYESLKKLLRDSNRYAPEFSQDTQGLSEIEKDFLRKAEDEAIEQQLKCFIDQLLDDYDPQEGKQRLSSILETDYNVIEEVLYDELVRYINLRHDKKRKGDKTD